MNIRQSSRIPLVFSLLAVAGLMLFQAARCRADEGMWTFDNLPLQQLQARYGFTPTQAWLDHIRLASVRFNDGGSGSWVSTHGLVLTNHHVALTQMQEVSSAGRDYVKNGFYARTSSEELKCPDLELNVLIYVENVTQRVQSAGTSGMSEQAALEARKAEIAKIEVEASTDLLVVLARKVDPWRRQMIKASEDKIESVETPAGEKIGKARFAAYGKSSYPDATFTLRLTFGSVKGYPMNGTQAPPKTTFYGLYDRAYSFDLKPPYNLPERYLDGKARLDLNVPVDFVSTCDIIGGNSGSPVVNKQGELVGLIFDGNIEGLVGDYVYNEKDNRAVAVHSGAIIEVLRKLYDAGALADELMGR